MPELEKLKGVRDRAFTDLRSGSITADDFVVAAAEYAIARRRAQVEAVWVDNTTGAVIRREWLGWVEFCAAQQASCGLTLVAV